MLHVLIIFVPIRLFVLRESVVALLLEVVLVVAVDLRLGHSIVEVCSNRCHRICLSSLLLNP